MVWADDREWDAAKFVSSRRGTLRRTVIQLYSGMLRNSRSMASWGVWEGRLTRNGGGGLYLEILSVLWLSDRTVRCVRWLYIQVIFKDSFTEPAARSCQAEEKCQSGFFFCLFFGSQWKFVCAAFGMKKSNFVCPWKYSQIHLRLPQLLRVQIGL